MIVAYMVASMAKKIIMHFEENRKKSTELLLSNAFFFIYQTTVGCQDENKHDVICASD